MMLIIIIIIISSLHVKEKQAAMEVELWAVKGLQGPLPWKQPSNLVDQTKKTKHF